MGRLVRFGEWLMSYDTAYRASDRYFGAEPDGYLLAHLDTLDPAGRVLDLGMGQGRNALWLARRGFRVEGIEPSETARAAVQEVAAMEGLPLGVHANRFQEFDAGEASFGTVLALGLIPILSWAELQLLKERVDRWL
ncbi:MAG TPA: methyltransferase domain-containing protein, partial [Candidatus Krumholzibacteria bacterium]|nr:methyltransferase domain-containing protein [Candidatus Krumholzibacteria bacterium]